MPEENNDNQQIKRKFIGVWFQCCHAYGRLYKNKKGTHYFGRCPKCLRSIKVPINPSSETATDRRFFRGG